MLEFILFGVIGLFALSCAFRILKAVFGFAGKILRPVFDFLSPVFNFIFGTIFVIAVICFIISLIIPDPVPLVDEVVFGGSALGSYTLVKVYN